MATDGSQDVDVQSLSLSLLWMTSSLWCWMCSNGVHLCFPPSPFHPASPRVNSSKVCFSVPDWRGWACAILIRTFTILQTYKSIAEMRSKTNCKYAVAHLQYLTTALLQLSVGSGFGSVGIRKYSHKRSRIQIRKKNRIVEPDPI
jgi:hypothetical protein